jgi:hypothetical protein
MSRCRACGGENTGALCPFCGTPMGESAPWSARQDPADAPTQVAPPADLPDPYADYYRPATPVAPAPAFPPAPPVQQYPQVVPAGYQAYGQPNSAPPPAPPHEQAAPHRPSGPPVLPILAGVLAVAVVAVGVLALPRLLDSGTPTVPTVTRATTVRSALATPSTTLPTTPIRTATVADDAEPTALAELLSTASGQQGQLNAAVDAHVWVAQLSSKYVGVNDPLQTTASGSHTFNAVDILAEYRRLSGRIPDATVIIADSRTFGKKVSYNGEPYWRTLALSPGFTSSAAVVSWCASTFPELTGEPLTNQCLPQQF